MNRIHFRIDLPLSALEFTSVASQDIRWIQRFNNYLKAFFQFERAVVLSRQRPLSELEKQGLIQAFEFTHKLGWNVLKDYLKHQGVFNLVGSRDTLREAFQRGLAQDGEGWMEMIRSRNLTSNTYNDSVVEEILQKINSRYFDCFFALKTKMSALLQS